MNIPDAIEHLQKRLWLLNEGRVLAWSLDDRAAVSALCIVTGKKAAVTLSGLFNCFVCGQEKCSEEHKFYLCDDCSNPPTEAELNASGS